MPPCVYRCVLHSVLFLSTVSVHADVFDIGSRRELFVDRYLVEQLIGDARLQLNRPQPAEIVLRKDRDWEIAFHNPMALILDRGTYKLFYSAGNRLAYAESTDGIVFSKPNLNLVEYNGSRENSLVGTEDGELMVPDTHPMPEVFFDTRPGVPEDERYKAFTIFHEERYLAEIQAWVSPNGWRWRLLREEPIIRCRLRAPFDGGETCFWSEAEQLYVIYARYYIVLGPNDYGWRSVARFTSPDFLNWTEAQPMEFCGTGINPPCHIYNNQTMPYFRAPHIYLSLAARFMDKRQALTVDEAREAGIKLRPNGYRKLDRLIRDSSETILLTTRGGPEYDCTYLDALIRPGLGAENWVTRSNYSVQNIVPMNEREMSIYVLRHNGQTSAHVQRYAIRTDGLASVRAPFSGGELVTRPFKFKGRQLEINYATSSAGSLRIEIQDATGKPIPGYSLDESIELIGDHIERNVPWKDDRDLKSLAGRSIRLRFVLRDADLYSFRFSAD